MRKCSENGLLWSVFVAYIINVVACCVMIIFALLTIF